MKYLIPILIICVLIVLIRGIVISINSVLANQDVVAELQKDLADKKKNNRFLKQRLEYVKNDEYVEYEAREKLGMVRDGEVVVLLPSPKIVPVSHPISTDTKPNWEKWIDVFF